jgi:DNA-binding response OmpR family regulator
MADRLASTPAVLRFGDIEVDVRAGALRRNGQRITLPDQPLHLLTALLERPGEFSRATSSGASYGPPTPSSISSTA